jgi:hypothetical protein
MKIIDIHFGLVSSIFNDTLFKFKSRFLSIGLVLIFQVSLFSVPINAMENGFDAPRDGRTVAIIAQQMGSIIAQPIELICTGFLYSKRIVLTAGHCLHNMQNEQRLESVQNGSDPVYLFKDLISQAEKYVVDSPYVEPKTTNAGFNNQTTITCTKGKTTKKVTGLTPKCPKGFKKK